MDITTRKYQIIEKVMRLTESQLEKIETTLDENLELDSVLKEALQSIKEGKTKPHQKVREKYKKWL